MRIAIREVAVLLLWGLAFGAAILVVPTAYSWWKQSECWLREGRIATRVGNWTFFSIRSRASVSRNKATGRVAHFRARLGRDVFEDAKRFAGGRAVPRETGLA